MAPTTPLGQEEHHLAVRPQPVDRRLPVHVCEMLTTLEAPVFIERVALGNNKQIMQAAARDPPRPGEPGRRAWDSPSWKCFRPAPPSGSWTRWRRSSFVREEMAAVFPVGNFRDRTKEAPARPAPAPAPPIERSPRILGLTEWRRRAGGAGQACEAARPAHQGRRFRRPGRADARRRAGRGRPGRRVRSFLAAFVRAGDALRHLQLPRAAIAANRWIRRWFRGPMSCWR